VVLHESFQLYFSRHRAALMRVGLSSLSCSRSWPSLDIQEGVHGLRSPTQRFCAALSRLREISNVSDVGDDLHHVVHRGAVGRHTRLYFSRPPGRSAFKSPTSCSPAPTR